MIHLGYETGTGNPVAIPLAHMAITGLTQQSGKTTTLEALIHRGELRAVVFVTKPGEKSFTEGFHHLPFFKEHADWEYVKELLEARRAESLSKWDGYLMRVCSRARTLQDVRANVEKELPKRKSVRPSHYEVLAGYLDLIIPELDRVAYTDKLDLARGVNVMDLGGMSDEMQSMVIRSTIEQIHRREKHTVLVLPEAWKFIPEGGRSAVFQALQTLVREGATNGNFVWLDAQDLAVVSKRILKSVSVWILGKQQEANEVARTINHLIEPLQIRPDMIKSLGIGQFLVCADSLPARRVYVQPRWLGELDALAIARGEESVETAQAIWRQKLREIKRQRGKEDVHVTATSKSLDATPNDGGGSSRSLPLATDQSGTIATSDISTGIVATESEDPMWKERAEKAEAALVSQEAEIVALKVELLNVRRLLNEYRDGGGDAPPNGGAALEPVNSKFDPQKPPLDVYQYVKARALQDPEVLEVLARRPELRVTIEPKVLEVDGASLRGGIALLIHKGFFNAPKNGHTTFKELQRIGRRVASANVYRELDNVAEMGFLTSEKDGYLITDLKVSVKK